jgi:uncharacterized protein (DUF983 family)
MPQHNLAREPNDELSLEMPSARRTAGLLGRALTLRCPNCGGGPTREHWLRMRPACGSCGMPIERGEPDYFIGSMMFNLILSEGLFLVLLVGGVIASWPDIAWTALEIATPLGMIAAPILLFPFSKLAWLAFDLVLRPDAAPRGTGRPPR